MKRLWCVFLFVLLGIPAQSQHLDSVQAVLDEVMLRADHYEAIKKKHIQDIQQRLAGAGNDLSKRYAYHMRLYEAYQKYQIDSAALYIKQNVEIAGKLEDEFKWQESQIALSNLLSAGGKFVEAKKLLDDLSLRDVLHGLKGRYYQAMLTFYSNYGLSSNNRTYFQESERYRDSMLSAMDPQSLPYQVAWVTKTVYAKDYDSAKPVLHRLCDSLDDAHPDRGLVTYLLGLIYRETGDIKAQTVYFAMSGIADIKNTIRDNASMQSLALSYYEQGDVDRARLYIERAINDAVFSNVRFRTIESSTFYPIIHAAFIEKEKEQQKQLLHLLMAISLLSVVLLGGVLFIYQQMIRLRRVRKALDHTNDRLRELNLQLLSSNTRLQESDHIKEAYIAQFFDICSTYIHKMDVMRKEILKKVVQQDTRDLKNELQSSDYLKRELEDLYANFDIIFINLYPTFVAEFNKLLLPQEHIVLKDNEHLNSELRIYALIRLGITDNTKIAGFLRYSLRTVYNYRVKTRNKVAGDKDNFEKMLMNIGNEEVSNDSSR
ncbi:DUF6377 domain-containing protein [Sphingobacterium sp. lm-10]|uniref:DUF6377 domain-containing protein n=1 Tax=Sphingobacterium sp. lm-10 TaxID=2944904 RepID=UPI00202015B6|nr:DUF6377 domain-containing protein [Sphingobacterium sp. lm-10]MCL7988771.1 DUF6377 domain-containing protein [Sphingobacterium sp. lm-10]